MIQRLQTIYLVFVMIVIATLCSKPVIHYVNVIPEGKTMEYELSFFYFNTSENGVIQSSQLQFLLIALAAFVLGLALFSILQYKDRKKQMQLVRINFLLMLALAIAFGVSTYLFIPDFTSQKLMAGSVLGIAMFIFLFYLNWRALMLIKKDEELVRSADRIR